MRLSYELHRRFFAEYNHARDNTKRAVSEAGFADWLYTTQQIMDALNNQRKMVGDYWIADYSIYSLWKALQVANVYKLQDSLVYVNMKEDSLLPGHTELDDEEHLYSETTTNTVRPSYAEQMEHHNEMVARIMGSLGDKPTPQAIQQAERKCPDRPEGRRVQLLNPQDFRDIQERMLTQLRISNGNYGAFETDASKLRKTIEFDKIDKYCFSNICFENKTNGFRPIMLKKSVLDTFMDSNEFRGNAEDNFVWWFRNTLTGSSN